ncbi:hypothetical protein ACH4C2_37755 [Streptomyces sp. NPDC018057]|uniref:hypothetical protein n=1 Tax=unclassified Streptomyces TaxID=2593676 RepID=UPI0037B60EE9
MSRFQFVDNRRDTYEGQQLCEVLDLNRSSYYEWITGKQARTTRLREDRLLAARIRERSTVSPAAPTAPHGW